jgi:hypothetical protein
MITETDRPTAIDTSICVHLDDIEKQDFELFGSVPVPIKPLRAYPDGAIRSGYLTLPAGWRGGGDVVPATVQLFLRSGRLTANGQPLSNPAFLCVPAGKSAPLLGASSDCEVIVIVDQPSCAIDAEVVLVPDVLAIEPFTPNIPGWKMGGFERRVLWLDPVTGADTRLLRVPGGFCGGGPNWHPVEEEIFCLEGDIAPDETRPMRAGSFLWNQKGSIHGFNEHTVGGCMLLEWHDGPWNLIPAPGAVRPG